MGQAWLVAAIEHYGYLAVLIAVAIESTGIPFPGETALLAAAVFAGTSGHVSIVGVIAAAAAGAILGDNFGYTIGKRGGYPLLRRFAAVLHINERHLAYAESYFQRHGDKTVFIGRFFAVLRAWAAFLAGVNHMPRRTFLIWNALGGIVWATSFGTLGYLLGNNLPLLGHILRTLSVGGTILFVVVGGIITFWLLVRRGVIRSANGTVLLRRLGSLLVHPDVLAADPPPRDHSVDDPPQLTQPEPEHQHSGDTGQS